MTDSSEADREVSVSRTVAASPERLWSMITDVTRIGEWSPETTSCAWQRGATGPTVGARFVGTNSNGSKTWTTTCTVVEAESPRSFVFDVTAGPFKVARWSYRIVANAGASDVTETWTDRRGRIVSALGKPLSGVADRASHNRRGMEATLAKLAAAAEAG
jgi:uncharacterized protein YndB with AHSA1/START domain